MATGSDQTCVNAVSSRLSSRITSWYSRRNTKDALAAPVLDPFALGQRLLEHHQRHGVADRGPGLERPTTVYCRMNRTIAVDIAKGRALPERRSTAGFGRHRATFLAIP
jgi:hypothetical protein